MVTITSICIKNDCRGRFKANISGPSRENVERAVKIIRLAIDHYKASIQSPSPAPEADVDCSESAVCDLETFIFEINKSRA